MNVDCILVTCELWVLNLTISLEVCYCNGKTQKLVDKTQVEVERTSAPN